MTAPIAAVESEAQRWRQWQDRGLTADRRRAVAMKWVLAAVVAVVLAAVFGGLL
jgi:hypothetical protein